MPQSAVYDFGDMLKSIPGSQGPESSGASAHLAVGAPPLSPRRLRFALSRMSSSPAAACATASLFTSLLDNLSNQQAVSVTVQHKRLERTQSAPAPSLTSTTAAAASAAAVNTSRYKTELCRPYEEFGVCKYGDKCQFAHGMAELRSLARHPKYKTELCRTYHTAGFCPYGPRCHFVHNEEEARQHNKAVAAILARNNPTMVRPRPSALSPALSLDSPSPASSLSQSPTSSMGSFFSSEPELHSPVLPPAPHVEPCPPSPSSESAEFRLPVFNRLSAPVLAFGDLML